MDHSRTPGVADHSRTSSALSLPADEMRPDGGFSELDPSLAEGGNIIFDREITLELRRHSSPQEPGMQENILVRIVSIEREGRLHELRVELSSDADLFFHFTSSMDLDSFDKIMRREQKLMCDFDEFPAVLEQTVAACIRDPTRLAVMFVTNDGRARMEFIQNMGYKYVELMALPFIATHEDIVRKHISYRYNRMKAKVILLNDHLHQIKAQVKLKNPSLYQNMEKRGAGRQ
ncbi:putative alpha-1,3-mannosyl-glycoprotein beta-1, 2-n-acetylglucosaminyltransferase [Carpediemonas membranifera]|uniref:Putative alpha-1,3-mannosyl-glycoprotein beta-1, 2-n-acetylglucosaminyltransferase n=1 Tax=Carpediemonas membranifera TaxID=201153 RepID=A0A8J6B706_9EUKA|nr:putative alpha-1,3-mannosyl-glycoprotein beta-1, 2-n-acetylglucosaminyltransferase [Carpediemonas membranifera]|eukprot:KAG9394394.1 putative alpha-1,3-mannosyl-glycoprotein beta-1, 2-n-acetylglucosaminyltransferase [Carpediemonas membranifera]